MRKIKFISILLVLSMLLTVPVFAFSDDYMQRNMAQAYNSSVRGGWRRCRTSCGS